LLLLLAIDQLACMAAPVPVLPARFESSKVVYERQLKVTDMNERSRLYIKKPAALEICPEAFATSEEPFRRDLPNFIDAAENPLPMLFLRREKKCYLTGRWGDFFAAKNLNQGDTLRILELTERGTGAKFFMVRLRVEVLGVIFG